MKKVVLLGDSIRQIGYGTILKEYLPKDVELWQPEENCRFAKYTLRMLFDYKANIEGADVIHWNNGLWDATRIFADGDLFTSAEEYVQTMCRIADILLTYGKVVIFATTTPTYDEYEYTHTKDVQDFNAVLVPELKKKGVIINDLFSLINQDVRKNIRHEDMLHLSEEGKTLAAEQVSSIIKKYL